MGQQRRRRPVAGRHVDSLDFGAGHLTDPKGSLEHRFGGAHRIKGSKDDAHCGSFGALRPMANEPAGGPQVTAA